MSPKQTRPTLPIRLATFSLLLLLGGCLKEVTRSRPEPPVPAKLESRTPHKLPELVKTESSPDTATRSADQAAEPAAEPITQAVFPETPIAWRNFVQDERLAAMIELAFEHNRDLRIAAARVEQARAYYLSSRGARLPQLDLAASGEKSRTPAAASSSGTGYTSSSYQTGVQISNFELDLWGRLRYQSESAQASYLASDWAARGVRLALIGEIGRTYLDWLSLGERLSLGRAALINFQKSHDLVRRLYEAGIIGALDLHQAEAVLAQTQAQLADLERLWIVSANTLELLIGTRPEQLPPAHSLGARMFLQEPPDEIPSALLLSRPDIQQAEQQLIAAGADIGSARAAFYPRISLSAALGAAALSLGNLFSNSTNWGYGLNLGLPIFDGGRLRANLLLAKARESENVALYEKAIQQAFHEVANLLSGRGKIDQQIDALQHLQRTQSERLRIAQRRYEAGVDNYLQVLSAQNDLFSAEQSLVAARQARQETSMALYVALGGSLAETPL